MAAATTWVSQMKTDIRWSLWPSPYTDDEQSSDEEASLTAPTADAPTPSTYYGDVFESSSSGEDASSDGSSSDESSDNDSPCPETSGLHDNPTHIEDDIWNSEATMVSEEEDASNLVFNPSFHMQGDDVPYGSTTDNSEDNAVPDNSEAVPDMQMHENRRTSSAQISETSHIEDNLHSDEDAPLTTPTADAPTASTHNGDIIDSSRSREGSSSDESSDNDSPCPDSDEEASVCYLFDSSSSSEGSSSDGSYSGELSGNDSPCPDDMVVPSSSSFIGDDFHDVSTTDNFVDVAVPDNSEAVAVPDNSEAVAVPDNSGDVAVPDNSEVVAFGVPGIQMHESPQPISSQISNPSNSKVNLQPTRRRRTAPAYFNDPESIGARVAKRKRGSIAPIVLATPLDATNHFQEVSALLANERVSQQDFLQFSKKSIRSLQKAIASSKRALREAPK